jgi:hypothetical protein
MNSFWVIRLSYFLTYAGNTLAAIGSLTLGLGVLGVFNMDALAFGLSSGVRVIGTIAIAGCLLSAIGYGISDHMKKN